MLRAFTGQQAIDLAGKVSPDAVLVKMTLPDFDGIELVRVLGRAPTIHATTPILMVSDDSVGKAERLEALGSGAWDVLAEPIDPNELILRLDTFIRAKQEADRVRDDGLTDPATGFYNVRGILQRVKEITADAGRHDRALTCVAFGSRPSADGTMIPSPELERTMSEPVAAALREATRLSDTIGRLGPGEFVVIAPGTDQEGAIRLADRVLEALDSDPEREAYGVSTESLAQVRAGFCALQGERSDESRGSPVTSDDGAEKISGRRRQLRSESSRSVSVCGVAHCYSGGLTLSAKSWVASESHSSGTGS